jgi:hypothetical protein
VFTIIIEVQRIKILLLLERNRKKKNYSKLKEEKRVKSLNIK